MFGNPKIEVIDTAYLMARCVPVSESGCWLWLNNWNHAGYGLGKVGGRCFRAHRLSWELHRGPIPAGLHVCHRCDTPACVNPEHLFLGTHDDNMRDRDEKGRNVNHCGTLHGNAKLSDDDVRAIRLDGRNQRDIARAYGVSQSQIWCIKRRRTWRHVE